jgi:hypothetical protein
MDGCNTIGVFEQAMQNGRRDVIRQISVDGKSLAACEFFKIHGHYVALHDFNIFERCGSLAQAAGKRQIQLNGKKFGRALRKPCGHFAVASADLHPHSIIDVNFVRNSFLPTCVGKKMLAKPFR